MFLDRLALQRRMMNLLRKIEHCVDGVQTAWEETFRYCNLLIFFFF